MRKRRVASKRGRFEKGNKQMATKVAMDAEVTSNQGSPTTSLPEEETGYLYTIKKGDTLGNLAARFHLSVYNLVQANLQLSNPTKLLPGEHLRIPIDRPTLPCCILLQSAPGLPPSQRAVGCVTIWRNPQGYLVLTFTGASLPAPATLGQFDTYLGSLHRGDERIATLLLECNDHEQPTAWCGTRILPEITQVPTGTLSIIPFHSVTAVSGSPVLVSGPPFPGQCATMPLFSRLD